MLDFIKEECLKGAAEFWRDDFEKGVEMLSEVVNFIDSSLREGILALEDLRYEVDAYFGEMLKLVIDGFDKKDVEEFIIQHFFMQEFASAKDAYVYYFHGAAALAIQKGISSFAFIKTFAPIDPRIQERFLND